MYKFSDPLSLSLSPPFLVIYIDQELEFGEGGTCLLLASHLCGGVAGSMSVKLLLNH